MTFIRLDIDDQQRIIVSLIFNNTTNTKSSPNRPVTNIFQPLSAPLDLHYAFIGALFKKSPTSRYKVSGRKILDDNHLPRNK